MMWKWFLGDNRGLLGRAPQSSALKWRHSTRSGLIVLLTSEARAQYEEQLAAARDKAGAIIEAAQEAVAAMRGNGVPMGDTRQPESEELQEQVAYLKAFSQACRVQLRSYLEALLSDVETEWGRAHPGALPTPPQRGFILVSLFAGIEAVRRALDLLGVAP